MKGVGDMFRSTVGWMTRIFVVLMLTATLMIGIAQAADQRLSDAQAALEKARALVEASQPGGVSEKAARTFEKHTARAVDAIDEATAEIEAAKVVSDGG
jgi:hypothetical protein